MNDSLLRNAMLANALFCASSGLLLTLAAGPIAEWMGIGQSELLGLMTGDVFIRVVGIILLPYSALIAYLSRREDLSLPGQFASAMDMLWVVASYGLLLTQIFPLNTAGNWAVLIVADIVLAFALVQLWGLRIMNRGRKAKAESH